MLQQSAPLISFLPDDASISTLNSLARECETGKVELGSPRYVLQFAVGR
jgi:hypothetical protein